MAVPRAISGNQGRGILGGSTIAEFTKFDGTIDYGVKTYVAQSAVSGGTGYQKTITGNVKCSGTVEGLLDPNYPVGTIFNAGALIQMVLYNQYPTSYVSFQGRISTRTFGADINTGDPQPFTGTFESDGVVTINNM